MRHERWTKEQVKNFQKRIKTEDEEELYLLLGYFHSEERYQNYNTYQSLVNQVNQRLAKLRRQSNEI